MRRFIYQAAIMGLTLSGTAMSVMAAGISGVTVTPARPTAGALITWDVSDSLEAGKQNNWMAWSRGSGAQASPGQSFYVSETIAVTAISLQLNSTLTGESIVKDSNNAPVIIDLETYSSGGTVSPSLGLVSYTGNLPANFDDNAWNHGQWVTFTFDTPTELSADGYYGFRLYFADAPEAAHNIKFNTGYWGDGGVTNIDGRPGHWTGGGYSSWDWQTQAGVEDLQFVLIGTSAAVPEPMSFGLLGTGAALLLRRRR